MLCSHWQREVYYLKLWAILCSVAQTAVCHDVPAGPYACLHVTVDDYLDFEMDIYVLQEEQSIPFGYIWESSSHICLVLIISSIAHCPLYWNIIPHLQLFCKTVPWLTVSASTPVVMHSPFSQNDINLSELLATGTVLVPVTATHTSRCIYMKHFRNFITLSTAFSDKFQLIFQCFLTNATLWF